MRINLIYISLLIISCTKDYNEIGNNFLNDNIIDTEIEYFDVIVNQKLIPPFKSSSLPAYQLGEISDGLFGKRKSFFVTQLQPESFNPSFGMFSQEQEIGDNSDDITIIEENETIKEVYIEIPFYNNTYDTDGDGVIDSLDLDPNDINSDSDGDGISDIDERRNGTDPLNIDTDNDGILDDEDTETINPNIESTVYDIDSLIGNINSNFKIKIQELDYFLADFDSDNNFETVKKYYSNDSFIESFAGDILFDDEVEINIDEVVIYDVDNPDTEEVDESLDVIERLSPRLKIPLDEDFFQSKIIQNEGSSDLLNNENFNKFFKGIIIKAYDFSEPLLLILDYGKASINIKYEYDKYNKNGTDDDTNDDTIDKEIDIFSLNLLGNQINIFENDAVSNEINQNVLSSSENLQRVFLKGGEGLMAEIDLFKDVNGNDIVDEIKSNGWLINEANLTFYVDKQKVNQNSVLYEPERLFLYNINSKLPIIDYFLDNSQGQKPNENKVIHSGLIQLDEDNNGVKYKIRISEHVKNIIRNDSINEKLGLVVSSDISNFLNTDLKNSDGLKYIPISSAVNPLGTVIYGPNPEESNSDKKIKLELYYTKLND